MLGGAVVIAYRFQTIPEHPRFGVLVEKDVPAPALFLTPEEAKEIVIEAGTRITIALIQSVVASYYGLPAEHMRGSSRSPKHAHPRQMAMLLCRQLTKSSLPDIGTRFGARHHTTIIHGIRASRGRIEADPKMDRDYEAIRTKLAV